MIGATQVAGVPWLGANTQHESMHEHLASSVRWDITGFSGPGPMTVYSQGQLGQIVGEEWFRAAGGGYQGSKAIPRNTHVHPNWVFGAPGHYQVNITQSAQLNNGKKFLATRRSTSWLGAITLAELLVTVTSTWVR